MNRKYKVMIIITILLFVFISISIALGYFKNSLKKELKISNTYENKVTNDKVKDTSYKEKIASPNATIHRKQLYKKCGHVIEDEIAIPKELVNKNESEIQKYYYGWSVEKFSEKEICLYREIYDICQEHFIVKDVDGVITVYNKNEKDEEKVYLVTEILTKYLPKEDTEKLSNGIEIIGKKNLYMLLQDYE
ncbi:MAG: BofC C-terminal domain-containing protein [Clostridia bacterium]|nr:BofC C-terminal domain-containing protein [Clostridia bacterium]